jgi:uncharacterized protein YyaL (SSP411 family)
MAAGGLYDHLGGGFARYATDRQWLVPHFARMLYANALLARVYPGCVERSIASRCHERTSAEMNVCVHLTEYNVCGSADSLYMGI